MRAIATQPTADRVDASIAPGLPWLAGLWAGGQTVVLSLLLAIVPAVTVFVASAADPVNAQVTWGTAASTGLAIWYLGHGGTVGAATMPLIGFLLVSTLLAYVIGRRSARPTWSAVASGAGVFALVTAGVGLVVGMSAGPDWPGVARASVATFVAVGLGLACGSMRQYGAPRWNSFLAPITSRLPNWARVGLTAAVAAVLALLVLATVLLICWIWWGRERINQIVIGLGVDWFSGTMLGLAHVLILPTMLIWVASFLSGAGFAVGITTSFTPDAITPGPLPAVPLLGALPQPDGVGGLWTHLPFTLMVSGLVAGWIASRRSTSLYWWEPLASAVVAAAGICMLIMVLGVGASGSLGDARMSTLGPFVLLFVIRATAFLAAGVAVGLLVFDKALRARLFAGRSRDDGEAVTELIDMSERRRLGADFYDQGRSNDSDEDDSGADDDDSGDDDDSRPGVSDDNDSDLSADDDAAAADSGETARRVDPEGPTETIPQAP